MQSGNGGHMAEEEAGFTFIDKRKSVTAESNPRATEVCEASQRNAADAESPSTVMLLLYCVRLLAEDAWQKLGTEDVEAAPRGSLLTEAKLAIDAVSDLVDRLASASEGDISHAQRR